MKPGPTAGKLRHRIVIRRQQDFPDGTSGVHQDFPEVARVWAAVVPVGGGVYLGSVQIGTAITHRITLRRRTDIGTDHVIDHDGRRFRVKRSADLGTGREFTVLDVEELGETP